MFPQNKITHLKFCCKPWVHTNHIILSCVGHATNYCEKSIYANHSVDHYNHIYQWVVVYVFIFIFYTNDVWGGKNSSQGKLLFIDWYLVSCGWLISIVGLVAKPDVNFLKGDFERINIITKPLTSKLLGL